MNNRNQNLPPGCPLPEDGSWYEVIGILLGVILIPVAVLLLIARLHG